MRLMEAESFDSGVTLLRYHRSSGSVAGGLDLHVLASMAAPTFQPMPPSFDAGGQSMPPNQSVGVPGVS